MHTKIHEYMKDEDDSKQIEIDRARILTQSEINEKLKDLDKWIFKHNEFQLKKVIGRGGFAEVYWNSQLTKTGFNNAVAVKKLKVLHFTQYSFEPFNR